MEIKKHSEIIESIVFFDKENNQSEADNTTKSTAKIRIYINYKTNTFDVKTENDRDVFKFQQNSHESNHWKAVCEAIINGIDEAKKRLAENSPTIDNK